MKPKLKITLLVFLIPISTFLVVVAMQPTKYRISRSATIAAPPSAVFPHVNDLHNWDPWSPWAKLDPAATKSFTGPPAGKDSSMSWSGNDKMGEGSMTITESRTDEFIQINLTFIRPMEGTSTTEFTFTPRNDLTDVTWTMTGTNNFIGKAANLILNMEKMLGGQFESGLASLKSIVETQP